MTSKKLSDFRAHTAGEIMNAKTNIFEPKQDQVDAERAAFIEAHYRYFDLTEDRDAWGRPQFKHPMIEAKWQGWKKRALMPAKENAPGYMGDIGGTPFGPSDQ